MAELPSEQPSTARRFADAFGDACVALGIRSDASSVVSQVLSAYLDPSRLFAQNPNWPCALNDSGLPIEMSVKLDGPGSVSLRTVVDGTDHRLDADGNWQNYLDRSIATTGAHTPAQVEVVRRLSQTFLADVPPRFPSRLVHGLGYSASDQSRGTLYFRTGWLTGAGFAERVVEYPALCRALMTHHSCPLPDQVEVVGFDFAAGDLQRTKVYTWLRADPEVGFSRLAGTNPDLGAAGELAERYAERVPAAARERACFLQSSRGAEKIHQRVFFFASAWGWDTPGGVHDLLRTLIGEFGVQLSPLVGFRKILAEHEIRMRLSMIAVGDTSGQPSVTFYFLPVAWPVAPGDSGCDSQPGAASLYRAAMRHLLEGRRSAGVWVGADEPAGSPSSGLVTASAAAAIADDPERHADLAVTAEWLTGRGDLVCERLRDRRTTADEEFLALAALALSRLRQAVPIAWRTVLAGAPASGSEALADALLALTEGATVAEVGMINRVTSTLIGLQRDDGGWESARQDGDLAATRRAIQALGSVRRLLRPRGGSELASAAVRRAGDFVHDTLIEDDSRQLALWLHAWLASGGSPGNATVGRVLERLRDRHWRDGRWLDGCEDQMTTITVLEAMRVAQTAGL